MPRGYWVALVTVTDPGGTLESAASQRQVVIEFESMSKALACYHSPEYKSARALREAACVAQVVITEGFES